MMDKVSLSTTQARILFWVVVILACTVIGLFSYNIYLKWKLKNVEVKIVEIKPVVLNIPEKVEVEEEEITEVPTSLIFEEERFDYEELMMKATDTVEKGQEVSVFVLNPDDSLRLIRASKLPYLITRVSTDTYSIALMGNFQPPSLVPQKTVYGVYVITSLSKTHADEIAFDLRLLKLPSYVLIFEREGTTYYSVVVGALPTYNMAKDYFDKMDWKLIMEKLDLRSPGFAGRVTP